MVSRERRRTALVHLRMQMGLVMSHQSRSIKPGDGYGHLITSGLDSEGSYGALIVSWVILFVLMGWIGKDGVHSVFYYFSSLLVIV